MSEIYEGFEGLKFVWKQFTSLFNPENEEDRKIVAESMMNEMDRNPNSYGPQVREHKHD